MSRESCISHAPRQAIAIVRSDYYQLTDKDCVAAAILNIFEYWANSAIAKNPNEINPWVGAHSVSEFEELLVGISTDKQIRDRLKKLEARGFIQTKQQKTYRRTLEFRFMVEVVQSALDELPKANGQTTVDSPKANGQTTVEPTVKQPLSQRSNNRLTLYKEDLKEDLKEDPPIVPQIEKEGAEVEQVAIAVEILIDPEPVNPQSQEAKITPKNQNGFNGTNIPARDGFTALTGKDPKTGKDYASWQGLLTEQGKSRVDIDPKFVAYVADSIRKYPNFKLMSVVELRREAKKYINRAQANPERLVEIEEYWRDFCRRDSLPTVSIQEIAAQAASQNLLEMLKGENK